MGIALLLHALAAVVWVGGMFFAHMALRPVAASLLEPPQRLALWVGVFSRFFPWVFVAIEPGMQFHAEGPEGQAVMVTIATVSDDAVTVDGNHPLAGVTLNFDVSITDIREASTEELEHGHVHGPHGHHHD